MLSIGSFGRSSSSLLILLGVLLAVGTGRPPPAAAQGRDTLSAESPRFHLLRQEEVWRLRPGAREGLLRLKAMPLNPGSTARATVGGEARAYARWYRNERWGAGPHRDGYLLQRVMLHGSVRTAGPPDAVRLRAFAQLKSGVVVDRGVPLAPPDKDLLGLNQAFLELGAPLGTGRRLTVRLGRQELHYGAGRMIAVREGPNVRLGYDALLGRYEGATWRAEAFAAKPTETPPGVLNNGWMPGRTLWGAVMSRQPAAGPALSLYYMGTDRRPSPLDRDLHATRHTIGTRAHGRTGHLAYDLEGAVQVGRYRHATGAEGPIRAWMAAGHLGYDVPELPGRPTIGVRADLSSGDRGDTGAHETFAAPYPSGRYTGAGSRLGPGNLMNVRPFVGVHLRPSVRLQLRTHVFWRTRATDAVYAIWGAPLRRASRSEARFVGTMPDGVLTWRVSRHVRLALEASHFVPGRMLRAAPPGRGLTHLGLRASYTF